MSKMLTEKIMQTLIPAVGDLVVWKGKKYTVESLYASGRQLSHISNVHPHLLEESRPMTLLVNTDGDIEYAPSEECRIIRTNPMHVMERLLAYLDKKGAIDWDQLDAEHSLEE